MKYQCWGRRRGQGDVPRERNVWDYSKVNNINQVDNGWTGRAFEGHSHWMEQRNQTWEAFVPWGNRERFENVTETTSVSPFQYELVLVLKKRQNFSKENTHGLKFTFFCMYIQIPFIHLIKFLVKHYCVPGARDTWGILVKRQACMLCT